MDNTASILSRWPRKSGLTIPVKLAHLGSGEEHIALLVDPRRFGLLRCWEDLLDEGVAGVFGLAGGQAELLALSFHAEKFAFAEAEKWLAERGFKPQLLATVSGATHRTWLRRPANREVLAPTLR